MLLSSSAADLEGRDDTLLFGNEKLMREFNVSLGAFQNLFDDSAFACPPRSI